jgi:hypothetical protein
MIDNKYPLPIYLNQKYVFDLLAIIENGFYQLATVKSTEQESGTSSFSGSSEIGLKNAFAFLGVSFSASGAKEKAQGKESEIVKEKIHTPNSLFAKMRDSLDSEELIKRSDFLDASTGEFVEFKLELKKNPLLETLESFQSLMNMALIFSSQEDGKSKTQAKKERQANQKLLDQISSMINQLKEEGNIDLIGNDVKQEFRVVLTIDRNFLGDPSLSEIADGEFSVLGKVTRVIKSENDGEIDLLRKTSLSQLQDSLLNQMFSGFEDTEEFGLKKPDITTKIVGPAIQIIPIGIFT